MSIISVTYFDSPFLFFYYDVSKYESQFENVLKLQKNLQSYIRQKDVCQYRSFKEYQAGEYVAVNHEGSWRRGIMDHHQKVWLIDYGKCIDVYVDKELRELPEPFKEMPSMIVRGSLQNIVPLEKHMSQDWMEMLDVKCDQWIDATRTYCEDILKKSGEVMFRVNEIALIKETLVNLGEIIVELDYGETLKISEELCRRKWGMKNADFYHEYLTKFYTPVPTLAIALTKLITEQSDSDDESSWDDDSSASSASTLVKIVQTQNHIQSKNAASSQRKYSSPQVVNISQKEDHLYLTQEEITKFHSKFVLINGRKCDVVTILKNKIADFNMAFKYSNFDEISVGRACKRKQKGSIRVPNVSYSDVGIIRNSIRFMSVRK